MLNFLCRYSRDKELNSKRYARMTQRGPISTASKDLKVGDVVYVEKVSFKVAKSNFIFWVGDKSHIYG
jgi:hypothetical protein